MEAQEKPAPRKRPAGRPRLTNKEQCALVAPPPKMGEPDTRKAKLETPLDRHDIYTSVSAKFGRAGVMLAEADADLARREEKWLELKMRSKESRDSIGGQSD
jgi:hypothetical protein